MKIYLSNEIQRGVKSEIKCPDFKCKGNVTFDEIKAIVDPEFSKKYEVFHTKMLESLERAQKVEPFLGYHPVTGLPLIYVSYAEIDSE